MPSELRKFWGRVWVALCKVIALAIFAAAHRGLDWVLKWAVPEKFAGAAIFLQAVTFVAFGIVYVHLSYELVAVFLPVIKRRRKGTNDG